MTISININKMQKTKDLDYLVEVGVEPRGTQGVRSDLSVISNQKTKSNFNAEFLLEKIVNKRNFFELYKRVKANKGSYGIDGMSVDELLLYLQEHYETLVANLLNGTYKLKPVRRKKFLKKMKE